MRAQAFLALEFSKGLVDSQTTMPPKQSPTEQLSRASQFRQKAAQLETQARVAQICKLISGKPEYCAVCESALEQAGCDLTAGNFLERKAKKAPPSPESVEPLRDVRPHWGHSSSR